LICNKDYILSASLGTSVILEAQKKGCFTFIITFSISLNISFGINLSHANT